MLAREHMDAAGVFLRRASESMRNNFAIYCGLATVHCRCYIGLECTILFSSKTHLVGCGPLRPPAHSQFFFFKQQSTVIGFNPPPKWVAPLTQDIFEGVVSTRLRCSILFLVFFFKRKSKNKTDGDDIEFYHSVFLNSYHTIAPLGIPWFPIRSWKGRTDANTRRWNYTHFFPPLIAISQKLGINLCEKRTLEGEQSLFCHRLIHPCDCSL